MKAGLTQSLTRSMTIGTLAKNSGVGVETVRFYERKGIIKRPSKIQGGFRHYTEDDAKKIRFVKKAQELGFTLKEIQEFLTLENGPSTTCQDVKKKADKKLLEVESKLKDLNKIKKSLKKLSEVCGDKNSSTKQCRVLDCFETGWTCQPKENS